LFIHYCPIDHIIPVSRNDCRIEAASQQSTVRELRITCAAAMRFRKEVSMEEWVSRALKRWPNVPALYGWLKLDRRGRWLIRGETISRPQINEVINRNYGVDERGCWYFQNGPQRGYMQLERAPFILVCVDSGRALETHNRMRVADIRAVFLDENGGLFMQTEHGPGGLLDTDLDWALERMSIDGRAPDERQVADALALRSNEKTRLIFRFQGKQLPVLRLDDAEAPAHLNFFREPKPD
jgi:hypothetical protein